MAKKIKIRLEPIGLTLTVNAGTPLVDIVHEYGVEFPCGGKGTCGGCRVQLIKGHINMTNEHARFIEKLNLGDGWRLACFSIAEEDITLGISQYESLILADNTIFQFSPKQGHAIAVDLGSTTIVAQLLDLHTATVLDVQTARNPQSKHGADIISRIEFGLKENGLKVLSDMVREKIGGMIESMLTKHNVLINEVLIVGNTAMHHIFGNIDVAPLSQYPFEPKHSGLQQFTAQDLGWDFFNDDKTIVKFLPSIGSYVGSDILAGILASGIHKSEKYIGLIDLGTNGEIVIGNKDNILAASTAAGPAFEGTNIDMGMTATTGAISSAIFENGEVDAYVIGNTFAKGICGSGIIDVTAGMLKTGLMDEGGTFSGNVERVHVKGQVYVSQKDIREFQLAKAAIAAGMEILINKLGITTNDIEKIYIAGGFGNYINIENAIYLGLLEFPEEKIYKMGNLALLGAKIMLYLPQSEIESVLGKTSHVSLEGDPMFQDIYITKMMF